MVDNEIYVLHDKEGKPVLSKGPKKQPKAYLNPLNAKIALRNMGNPEDYSIVVYRPLGVVTEINGEELLQAENVKKAVDKLMRVIRGEDLDLPTWEED
jgi:hypothetical protein